MHYFYLKIVFGFRLFIQILPKVKHIAFCGLQYAYIVFHYAQSPFSVIFMMCHVAHIFVSICKISSDNMRYFIF